MEEIKNYKTEDGKIFTDKRSAIEHERDMQFLSWYIKTEGCRYVYMGCIGYVVDPMTLLNWLRENESMVLQLLGAITNKPE